MNREKLRASLVRHEDLRLTVYDDKTGTPLRKGDRLLGHPTIGVGRNLAGLGIREYEAYWLLDNDINDCQADLMVRAPWWVDLSEVRARVLLELRLALGGPRFSGFVDMLGALKIGDYDRASIELLDSVWADAVGFRAIRLAEMLRTGKDLEP